MRRKKFDIQVATERCTGCLMCQLACSDRHIKVFNPSVARVTVEVSGLDCSIRFTEECDKCGICVDYCFYGALHKEPMEVVE